jgi:hypothetical protein
MDFAQWRFSAVSTADITQYQMMWESDHELWMTGIWKESVLAYFVAIRIIRLQIIRIITNKTGLTPFKSLSFTIHGHSHHLIPRNICRAMIVQSV